LGRKGTEVLKEGETEWSADRFADSDRERWKDLCKPSASAGRRGSDFKVSILMLITTLYVMYSDNVSDVSHWPSIFVQHTIAPTLL